MSSQGVIDIVCTTFNRFSHTSQFIKHLSERTKTPYRLIVVDNNSTDETQAYLLAMKEQGIIHHLILLGENYGIHMAKNYGLELVRSEPYYIDTDNDLLCADLEPDWVQKLIDIMDKNPQYGAIACRPQVLVGSGENAFDNPGEVVKFDHVGAHLRIMRTQAVRDAGGWEKIWDAKRNHEDVHIARALEKLGLETGYAKNVRCWHMFATNWGYGDMPVEEHGHREMWPPPEHYDTIINSFDPKTWSEIKK